MAKKNIIEENNAKINALLNDRNKEISLRESMLKAAEEKAADAEAKSVAAVEAGNDEGFADAQQNLYKAKLDIEMNKKRIEYLKALPLIPEAECRDIENTIREYLSKEEAADGEEFIKFLTAARPIARRWEERIAEANNLFRTLELDACKINTNLPTSYTNNSLPSIVRKLCVDNYIRGLTGEQQCHPWEVKL